MEADRRSESLWICIVKVDEYRGYAPIAYIYYISPSHLVCNTTFLDITPSTIPHLNL